MAKFLSELGKWSRKYKKCKKCKTTDKPYAQKGYCSSCWGKILYKKNKAYYKEYYKKYWIEHKDSLLQKRREEIVLIKSK